MKYYLRKDSLSEIEGPFDLAAIRGWIAGGRFTTEYEALEDRGQSTAEMKASSQWTRLEEIFSRVPPLALDQPPQAFLAVVRQRSCYHNLRLGADLLALATWAGCLWSVFLAHSILASELFIRALAMSGLSAVGVAVGRLICILLADIGDVVIEQNRRKRAPE